MFVCNPRAWLPLLSGMPPSKRDPPASDTETHLAPVLCSEGAVPLWSHFTHSGE